MPTEGLLLFVCRRMQNREAARRSRQRKQAILNSWTKTAADLKRERVLLLQCVEYLSDKAFEVMLGNMFLEMLFELKKRKKWQDFGSRIKKEAEIPSQDLDDIQRSIEGTGLPLASKKSKSSSTALDGQLAVLSSQHDVSPRGEDENSVKRSDTNKKENK